MRETPWFEVEIIRTRFKGWEVRYPCGHEMVIQEIPKLCPTCKPSPDTHTPGRSG